MKDPDRPYDPADADEPQGSHRMPTGDWFPEFSQEEKEPKPTTPLAAALASIVELERDNSAMKKGLTFALENFDVMERERDAAQAKLAAAREALYSKTGPMYIGGGTDELVEALADDTEEHTG